MSHTVAGCAEKGSEGASALASCRGVLMPHLPGARFRERKHRCDVFAILDSHLLFYSQVKF